jgi:hypothetical protein
MGDFFSDSLRFTWYQLVLVLVATLLVLVLVLVGAGTGTGTGTGAGTGAGTGTGTTGTGTGTGAGTGGTGLVGWLVRCHTRVGVGRFSMKAKGKGCQANTPATSIRM